MKARPACFQMGVVLSGLILAGGLAQARGNPESPGVRSGTLACGGNHFSRLSGSEQHRTSYLFRNYDGKGTIEIDRFQLFDANGDVLFDFPGIDPEFPPGVKTELGPHETTQINTADILFLDLGAAQRPIQAHVEWSYSSREKGAPLDGSTVRTVRADTGEERSRASSHCTLIRFRR